MGCDIHAHAEKRINGKWRRIARAEPFEYRDYGTFAFLAGVRNYSGLTPIAEARGMPEDVSEGTSDEYESWRVDAHSASWLSLEELLAFDYGSEMEDRRYTRQVGPNSWDGCATCEPGQGKRQTWREFLGEHFFADLEDLKAFGAERVVFWFDN